MSRLQPAYDIITGAELPPASHAATSVREPLRESQWKRTTTNGASSSGHSFAEEELRGQLNTLQYELDALKQERDLQTHSQQRELQNAQARAEAETKRASAAVQEREAEKEKVEKIRRQWTESSDRLENEKGVLEKRCRGLVNDARGLREEYEEAREEVESLRRKSEREYGELERRNRGLEAAVEEVTRDVEGKVNALRLAQERLKVAEERVEVLEGEVVGLRGRAGDGDALEVVRRELEGEKGEVSRLYEERRGLKRDVEVLRERAQGAEMLRQECAELRARVEGLGEVEMELSNVVRRKQALEDERAAWASYMEEEGEGQAMNYETPEEMARAFAKERIDRINFAAKLGAVQPELESREQALQELRREQERLISELEVAKTAGVESTTAIPAPTVAFDAKAKTRLEKQKRLALKEVEHLRQQIKEFDMDEEEKDAAQPEDAKAKRIAELDDLLGEYREELQKLHSDLSQLETQQPANIKKRSHEEVEDPEADEQRGELIRRARALQTELEAAQQQTQTLQTALEASNTQLAQLRESSKTRILSLKDNPTSRAESVKLATLTTLREENAALLAQLEGNLTTKVVPISTLQDSQHQTEAVRGDLATAEKKLLRLKQIYTSKSLEFREAVASVLGWKLDFQPNGRVKATSILYPSRINADGEEEENSIVFDGENGTMKVSGGARSEFAQEIRSSVEFWVDGRGEVPCFLAALTLEFYERTTRAVG
ncbi:hypothetical protein MBLNU230_g8160t1 [Neophaeotheca triangularis]